MVFHFLFLLLFHLFIITLIIPRRQAPIVLSLHGLSSGRRRLSFLSSFVFNVPADRLGRHERELVFISFTFYFICNSLCLGFLRLSLSYWLSLAGNIINVILKAPASGVARVSLHLINFYIWEILSFISSPPPAISSPIIDLAWRLFVIFGILCFHLVLWWCLPGGRL